MSVNEGNDLASISAPNGVEGNIDRDVERLTTVPKTVALIAAVTIGAASCASPPSAGPRQSTGPVHSGPSDSPDELRLSDVARLRCDENGATLLTPQVRPQRDGVHIEVESTFDTGFFWASGGDNADEGTTRLVLEIEPGRSKIGCYLPGAGAKEDAEVLFVKDPSNIWVAPHLDCRRVVAGIPEYGPGARGEKKDPVALTRTRFAKSGDEVRRAGYPEQRPVQVLVKRNGRAIHLVEWWRSPRGGWLMDNHQSCSGPG